MKHIVTVLLIASLMSGFAMIAVAEKVDSSYPSEYGDTMSHLILQERSVFSGLVDETAQGIVIITSRGTFFLKGADLEVFVGKNVRVTGVVRADSIFPLKIYNKLQL